MKHVTYLKKLNTNALSLATAVALVVCGFTTGCSSQNIQPADSANREVINQVSLLQGLTFGDYNGSVKVGRLKQFENLVIAYLQIGSARFSDFRCQRRSQNFIAVFPALYLHAEFKAGI